MRWKLWGTLLVLLIAFGAIVVHQRVAFDGQPMILGDHNELDGPAVEIPESVLPASMIEPALQQEYAGSGSLEATIRGLIVPHHALASELIAQEIARLDPKTSRVIVIGPNHQMHGTGVLTTATDLLSAWGRHDVDAAVVDSLVSAGWATIDNEYVRGEHSVVTVLPFLNHFLPDARVVPLVIHPGMNESDLVLLAEELAALAVDSQTVVIAAVDFSHYLLPEQADVNDAVTAELIVNGDAQGLRSLSSDYLDSPESISLLMKIMDVKQRSKVSVMQTMNSAEITGQTTEPSTSYVVVEYR